MREQINDLLRRAERRAPKLIDQLALKDIREAVTLADNLYAECSVCYSEVKSYIVEDGDGVPYIGVVPCSKCSSPPSDELITESLQQIARRTNDPDILKLVGVLLRKDQ